MYGMDLGARVPSFGQVKPWGKNRVHKAVNLLLSAIRAKFFSAMHCDNVYNRTVQRIRKETVK